MADAPVLDVQGATAGYGGSVVIRDVDLQVGEGETLVLVGPNGHGKTTLMRAVSGLLGLRSGSVTLEGRRIDSMRAEALPDLGLVHIPQGDHLFPELTVEDNLLMGAFSRGTWRERRRALATTYDRFPQLREHRQQRASSLSGGERRQVALGRGLMRPSRLLIVDEPSLGLAPVIIEQVYATLADLARETTLLLVEENFAHIQHVADRVCVLEMGRIMRSGSPEELAADPTVAQAYLGVVA